MFIGDYRPTKRVGVEELDGAAKLFRDRVDECYSEADSRMHFYEGALITLLLIRDGRFEYPRDFMAVFENQLDEYLQR